MLKIYAAIILLFVSAFLAGFSLRPAMSHEAPSGWSYSEDCCSNQDCQEIPASAVVEGPNAIIVSLDRATHKMLITPMVYRVAHDDARLLDAPDGVFHACIAPQVIDPLEGLIGGRLICLYRPARGF